MGDNGFLCPDVPEAYGGAGADFLYSVIVVEEMTRTNHGGLSARLHGNVVVPYITAFATEEQKRRYLPGAFPGIASRRSRMSEPQAGSDLAAIRTTAAEDGGRLHPERPEDVHQQRDQRRPLRRGRP